MFALRNTHHVGRVGTYGEQAVEHGLVSIFFVNVLIVPGRVAPCGGIAGRLGTDPICIAFPGTKRLAPFVLDFATSRVAAGKVRVALNEKKQVPTGWIIDAEGRDSTNPGTFFGRSPADGGGALLPFGEHKGSGLSVACELLAGVLTGAGAIHDGLPNRGVQNGMFAILIDPEQFADARLAGRRDGAADRLGEILAAARRHRSGSGGRRARAHLHGAPPEDGIPIDDTSWGELTAAAKDVGLPADRIP